VADELTAKIVFPSSDAVKIRTGESINFKGAVASCDSPSYSWSFGDSGIEDSDKEDPGDVTFPTAGVYEVTFTVTDGEEKTDNASVTVTVCPPGDINGNGKVEMTDAILILQILAGTEGTDPNNIHSAADVNDDDQIGMVEVIYILRKLSGSK